MPKVSKKLLKKLQAKTPQNVNEAMARYCALMEEIKDRANSVRAVLTGQVRLRPRVGVELSYLQLRIVCELIALACAMAHGDFGVVITPKVLDEDRPGVLLKMLERLHSDFYPRPFKQIHDETGVLVSVEDIHTGFLTREDLPRLYALCGNELHCGDLRKVGRYPRPENSQKEILYWYEKVLNLLGNHKIKLFNSTHEIWIGMQERTHGKVHWGFMVPISPV